MKAQLLRTEGWPLESKIEVHFPEVFQRSREREHDIQEYKDTNQGDH